MTLLVPASAGGDIYKWTDEQGSIVYSNSLPEKPHAAANVERVIKERPAPPREQALQERIDNLERQLQAPPATPAPPSPAPTGYHDGSYTYPPPAPPAHISSNAPVFHPGHLYPLIPAYSYVVFPVRPYMVRPAFHGGYRGVWRAGSSHRGRR
jgi:hypothetical protein